LIVRYKRASPLLSASQGLALFVKVDMSVSSLLNGNYKVIMSAKINYHLKSFAVVTFRRAAKVPGCF